MGAGSRDAHGSEFTVPLLGVLYRLAPAVILSEAKDLHSKGCADFEILRFAQDDVGCRGRKNGWKKPGQPWIN
jgi:hypothetical protein